MSIIPSPGQMGPGTGLIGLGTGLMRHPTLFKGLGMGPALTGLGFGIYLADLQSARREGFGNDVHAFRQAQADKITTRIVVPFTTLIMSVWNEQTLDISSGGGGPGESPISTVVPPSIEETGEILSNPSIAVEVPSSPKPRARGPKGTLIKCPVGYYWDKRTGRCLKSRKKG
jgi:hypothetical protein